MTVNQDLAAFIVCNGNELVMMLAQPDLLEATGSKKVLR